MGFYCLWVWAQKCIITKKSTFGLYKHSTSLSNYIWEIKKKQGRNSILKYEIIRKSPKI